MFIFNILCVLINLFLSFYFDFLQPLDHENKKQIILVLVWLLMWESSLKLSFCFYPLLLVNYPLFSEIVPDASRPRHWSRHSSFNGWEDLWEAQWWTSCIRHVVWVRVRLRLIMWYLDHSLQLCTEWSKMRVVTILKHKKKLKCVKLNQ